MRRQRYASEADVLEAIERARERMADYAKQAEDLEFQAKAIAKQGHRKTLQGKSGEVEREQCNVLLNKADKLWKKGERVQEKVLPKLGEKLSIIRTGLLVPADDISIPA